MVPPLLCRLRRLERLPFRESAEGPAALGGRAEGPAALGDGAEGPAALRDGAEGPAALGGGAEGDPTPRLCTQSAGSYPAAQQSSYQLSVSPPVTSPTHLV